MTKRSTSFFWILLMLAIVGAGVMLTRQREVVGVDQIGVVVSPGGGVTVHPAGARPLVLPLIQKYVRLTAKPVSYQLTDGKRLVITGAKQQKITIGCQVRYQVADAAKLVAAQGIENPQTAIETLIHKHLTDELSAGLKQENTSLDDVQTRVILVAGIHDSLKKTLEPLGINILSFDLFSW